MILNKKYHLDTPMSITKEILKGYVKLFWRSEFFNIHSTKPESHLLLMCKVLFEDSTMGYRTLGDMRKVNFTDRTLFTEHLTARLSSLSESYSVQPISQIEFIYIVREGEADNERLLLKPDVYEVSSHNYNNFQLPLSMNPLDYGEILATQVINERDHITRYVIKNTRIFTIDVSSDETVNNVVIEDAADIKWLDTKISDTAFKREIGKNVFYIENGEITLKSKVLPAKAFPILAKGKKLSSTSFMTIDIETVNLDGPLRTNTLSYLWLRW
jgi:hypothetical protein